MDGVSYVERFFSFMTRISPPLQSQQLSPETRTPAFWDRLADELSQEWNGVEPDCEEVSHQMGALSRADDQEAEAARNIQALR